MRTVSAIAVLSLSATSLAAQSVPVDRVRDSGTPAWMRMWSPLRSIADHPRRLTRAPDAPGLLLIAAPRVGLFWSLGNPAGLGFEIPERWAELEAGGGLDDGRYRRPLDERNDDALRVQGHAWQPLGPGAAAGRVVFDRVTADPASFADIVQPHPSSPLVVADTALRRMRRTRARLEGGLGLRLGDWALGLAGGVQVHDDRSHQSRIPHLRRVSQPGAALGLARRLPLRDLWLSAYGRWTGGRENINVIGQPVNGVVYQLEGYAEPSPRELAPPEIFFTRQFRRNAYAAGLALRGALWDVDWVVYGERTWRREKHASELVANRPAERWEADGRALGAAAQRPFLAGALLATTYIRASSLDGDAYRHDLEGAIFRANESVLDATTDLRYLPPGSPWMLALVGSLQRESRRRNDFIAEIWSDIEGWTTGIGLEVARALGPSTSVSLAYGASFYWANSSIPNPELMGPIYQELLAPELSLYATSATATLGTLGIRHRFGPNTSLLLRAQRESVSPRGSQPQLPFAPRGERTRWNGSLALVLGG